MINKMLENQKLQEDIVGVKSGTATLQIGQNRKVVRFELFETNADSTLKVRISPISGELAHDQINLIMIAIREGIDRA